MSERYTKLFSQEKPLYAEGSPVIIMAGALLLDNVGGNVLAQLKFKNVSPKIVKALTVSVTAKDTVGRVIGNPTVHQYLDLNAERDAEFGQKTAISLPSENTRECEVRVLEAAFADNSVWTAPEGLSWEPVPEQIPLFPDDAELLKQYRMEVNHAAKSELLTVKDLWLCSCGAINRAGENACHCCETASSAMKNADLSGLRERCSARLAKEREAAAKAAEERRIASEKAAKKTRKILSIAIPAAVVIVALVIVATKILIPSIKYNDAIDLIDEGQVVEAYEKLIALDGYKDSADKANSTSVKYINEKLKIVNVGDTFCLGSYEQDNDESNGAEKIEWLVLAKENNRVLVISKYGLDYPPDSAYEKDSPWITAWDARKTNSWLSRAFLQRTFRADELTAIKMEPLLLDDDEAEEYFSSDSARQCKPTALAIENGVYVNSEKSLSPNLCKPP